MKRVESGDFYRENKNAVFLAIYVKEISPWKYFDNDIKNMKCPALIMIDRWDGRMGFPGGTVDGIDRIIISFLLLNITVTVRGLTVQLPYENKLS